MSEYERLGNGGWCNYLGELLQSWKNHMLFQAVLAGHPRCVLDALIKLGADVNMCNSHGETPLTLAVKNGHPEYMESLIKAGARVNYRAGTLLWFSASRYGLKPLQTLLRAGISINNIAPSTLNMYLRSHKTQAKNEVVLILAAAGEKIDEREVRTPGFLKPRELSLMHLCRETIRNYLLLLDERKNLFIRIPQLELPPMMVLYLLYNVSLGDTSVDISAIENI